MSTSAWTEMPTMRKSLTIAVPLAALAGAILLGVGQGDYWRAMLVASAAVAAFVLTDLSGLFRLNQFFANAGAVLAVGVAALGFTQSGSEGKLLAIANLLVYLQIILLFQNKNVRLYWHMIVLSMLQVVVGAALSLSPMFGILLLGYSLLVVFAVHVFFLSCELGWMREDEGGTASRSGRNLVPAPQIQGEKRRWPFGGRRMTLNAVDVAAPRKRQGLLRRYIKTSLAAMCFAAPVAAVVFFVSPRLGSEPWRGGQASQQRAVGFSQEVRLGELGQVALNPEVVMRVKFIDTDTGESVRLENAPLLRGSVVTKYEGGKWQHHGNRVETEKDDVRAPPRVRHLIRQEIALEPLNEPVVFSVYPAFASRDQPVEYDIDREQLTRNPERLMRSQLNLQLETTGIQGRRQVEIYPARDRSNSWPYTSMPSDRSRFSLVTVKQVARQRLQQPDAEGADTYTKCKILENYLQNEGNYTYTLQPQPVQPGVDPVENFVAYNRQGNCEYFASALAMMLRSQGIPTRVVVGYQGGEWNAVGRFYQFRQLHTHSWVEAYLNRRQLAPYVRDTTRFPRGGWLILDPTAVTLAPQATADSGMLSGMQQATEYAELVWIKYVVGMTKERQQEALYGPIRQSIRQMLDPATFFASLRRSVTNWYYGIRRWLAGNWFSWRGGLLAVLVCGTMFSGYFAIRTIYRLMRSLWRRSRLVHRRHRPLVEFYDRFERIFTAVGISRSADQTQREYAMAIAGHLHESPATSNLALLPRRIADAFYAVRFGNRKLDAQQQRDLHEALAALEALAVTRRSRVR